MNILPMVGFVQALSQQTVDGTLHWKCMNELRSVTKEENEDLYYLLFSDEYHHVNFFNSFYCLLQNSGYVYLVDETIESGRDNLTIAGPNIYIQEDFSSELIKLELDYDVIYQLQNAIVSSTADKERRIQQFIDNFFNN